MRSLTRRASASFASRTARCSEVSFAGGSSARDSGSVGSSERENLTMEGDDDPRTVVERMDRMVPRGFVWGELVEGKRKKDRPLAVFVGHFMFGEKGNELREMNHMSFRERLSRRGPQLKSYGVISR